MICKKCLIGTNVGKKRGYKKRLSDEAEKTPPVSNNLFQFREHFCGKGI